MKFLTKTTGFLSALAITLFIGTSITLGAYETYTNKEHGFQFDHPKEAQIKESERGKVVEVAFPIHPKVLSSWKIIAHANEEKKELNQWLDLYFDNDANADCYQYPSNHVIEGAKTILFDATSKEGDCLNGGYYTISPYKSTVVKWDLGHDPHYSDVILPSFRFIE